MKFIKGIRADVKDVVDCAETLDVASPTKGLQTRKFKQVLFGCVPVKVSTAEDTSADARLQSVHASSLSLRQRECPDRAGVLQQGSDIPTVETENDLLRKTLGHKSQQTNSLPEGMYDVR